MVEGSRGAHVAETVINLILVEGRSVRVRVEGIIVCLRSAAEDRDSSQRDSNDTVQVPTDLGEARGRCACQGPVELADLAIEGGLIVEVDWGGHGVLRVEVGLEVDVVLLRSLGSIVAVRGQRVGLDADVGQTVSHRTDCAESSQEVAGWLFGFTSVAAATTVVVATASIFTATTSCLSNELLCLSTLAWAGATLGAGDH